VKEFHDDSKQKGDVFLLIVSITLKMNSGIKEAEIMKRQKKNSRISITELSSLTHYYILLHYLYYIIYILLHCYTLFCCSIRLLFLIKFKRAKKKSGIRTKIGRNNERQKKIPLLTM
jgi:GT2 family glycosyltransferase